MRNKANHPRMAGNGRGPGKLGTEPPARGVHCAKQSQFVPGGAGRPSPRPEALTLLPVRESRRAKQSQFACGHGDGTAGNEGDCRDRLCETKPISHRQERARLAKPPTMLGRSVRNKANSANVLLEDK